MAPKSDPKFLEAAHLVRAFAPAHARCVCIVSPSHISPCQVANGLAVREAWEKSGKPGGDAGIQNVRKHARRIRTEQAALAAKRAHALRSGTPAEQEAEHDKENDEEQTKKGRPAGGFRLRTDQVQKRRKCEVAANTIWCKVYSQATAEWERLVSTGGAGKGGESADAVAARFNKLLPAREERALTGKILKRALSQGRAGHVPKKPGPKPQLPGALVDSLVNYLQLRQTKDDEQGPRQLLQVAKSTVKGTRYEGFLEKASQGRRLLERVRTASPDIGVETRVSVDDRRWNWLTSSNVTTWFEGYMEALYSFRFIEELPADKFDIITIPEAKARRILNCDETHQKLSNEGEKGGPRASVYVNGKLGRTGKRKVLFQRHATMMGWVNYAGEVGAPHMMLASGAEGLKKGNKNGKDEEDLSARIRPEWTFGVPRVLGRFGLPPHEQQQRVLEPSFILTEKGGMETGGLEAFIRQQILPAYPNISPTWDIAEDGTVRSGPLFLQLDAGPDRLSECSVPFRQEMWDMGLTLFPGIPNGTDANQVMDELYGVYKTGSYAVTDDLVQTWWPSASRPRSSTARPSSSSTSAIWGASSTARTATRSRSGPSRTPSRRSGSSRPWRSSA